MLVFYFVPLVGYDSLFLYMPKLALKSYQLSQSLCFGFMHAGEYLLQFLQF